MLYTSNIDTPVLLATRNDVGQDECNIATFSGKKEKAGLALALLGD